MSSTGLDDSLQDGEVSVDEFKKALQNHCVGKSYADFPKAFKAFIDGFFRTVDVDGMLARKKPNNGFVSLCFLSIRFPCFWQINCLLKHQIKVS
jgi:hypothetical protein